MDLQQLEDAFDRAVTLLWDGTQLAITFLVLSFCGLLTVFFRAVSGGAVAWVHLAASCLPFFLCSGLLLAMGVLAIRAYLFRHHHHRIDYRTLIQESSEFLLGASFFSIPMVVTYLSLWLLVGVFVLLTEIPFLGPFLGSLFSFAPFFLNFGILSLCGIYLLALFFLAPIMALHGMSRMTVARVFIERVRRRFFVNTFLLIMSFLPLVIVSLLLFLASYFMTFIYTFPANLLFQVVTEFILMVPYAMALTPPILFFFHFSSEAHALVMGQEQQQYQYPNN